MEQGSNLPLMCKETTNMFRGRNLSNPEKDDHYIFRHPEILTYVFEIIFQMNAGAVMLTDSVYWFIIFPFLTIQDYHLSFMTVDMHTVNVILLLAGSPLSYFFHHFVDWCFRHFPVDPSCMYIN
ncbi:hypothetical protein TorRG33x02_199810 [Trema orientale]|uniref:Uncharacterized protein n=1 Tax=Trema orientale TaxID=63057 RepID=A0A2P5EFA4_TREOI|nr:hypothetical protein TorRG33x02_199810 [Trema orientale]